MLRKADEAICPSLGWVPGEGHPELSLEGEKEPVRPFPTQRTDKCADVLAGGSGRTHVSKDELQPQEEAGHRKSCVC